VRLGEIGEFGLIGRIAGKVAAGAGVRLGIGDDAAVTETEAGRLLLSTADMLVEGIHFDLSFTDPFRLGRKSLAVNVSDIAAMGGHPRHALLCLAIPADLPVEFLDRFADGVISLAEEFGVTLIGGDTCRSSSGLVISITLHGEQIPARIIPRSGARPGDDLFVTGTVGDSALGLELLRRGERSGHAVERHLNPTPRVSAGLSLAESGMASAMIDVSDGVLADLGHILTGSGVGARIDASLIPLSPYFSQRAPDVAPAPLSLALTGGEDYELLFTAAPGRTAQVETLLAASGVTATRIGAIVAGSDVTVTAADGSLIPPERRGFNHFAP